MEGASGSVARIHRVHAHGDYATVGEKWRPIGSAQMSLEPPDDAGAMGGPRTARGIY